jgi:hypothetical protein
MVVVIVRVDIIHVSLYFVVGAMEKGHCDELQRWR